MSDIEKLKKKLELDEDFKSLFINIKSLDEAIDLARQHGFDVNEEQISEADKLTDDILEAIAGGKGDTYKDTRNIYT